MISFGILLSIGCYLIQAENKKNNLYTQLKVQGKVQGLQGRMILNIEDNYLSLNPFDRFSFQVQVISNAQLSLHIIEQPENQQCEIIKSPPAQNKVTLKILCKSFAQPNLNGAVVSL